MCIIAATTRDMAEERQHSEATLRHTMGRIQGRSGAAELLHIKATTLEAGMKKLGIGKSYAA